MSKITLEVEKYLSEAPKWSGNRYQLKIGGLSVFFKTIKDAQKYYEEYLK